MASGLARGLAGRNKNVAVQKFYMGLDFSNVATRARLAEGSYLAVQISEGDLAAWDWSQWTYNPVTGSIVGASDPRQTMRYNYVVFGVSRMEIDTTPRTPKKA
jgi:hypothetical protein